jgi:hypothetical protein
MKPNESLGYEIHFCFETTRLLNCSMNMNVYDRIYTGEILLKANKINVYREGGATRYIVANHVLYLRVCRPIAH